MIKRLLKLLLFVGLAVTALFTRKVPASSQITSRKKISAKGWLLRTLLLVAALGAGGFFIAVSGIVSIKASSGHWAITRWFLNFSKERSVATHTLRVKAPPALDQLSLVLKGAGHYETGCRPCHGSPGLPTPRIARGMTPTPPSLAGASSRWDAGELFYIVKHGIKLTGMPAWPALERDDEVWAMVAFLRELPHLDAKRYRGLASGEADLDAGAPLEDLVVPEKAPRAVSESCARCHGMNGHGRGLAAFPRLAGQKPDYLLASLEAYTRGERHSGMMEPIAAGLSPEGMREVADYYSKLPSDLVPITSLQAEAVERGKAIATQGIRSQRVPACAACHGPSATRRNPIYPELAGQYADYLVLQLELFSKERRGGTGYHHLMHFVADRLTDEQKRDVALYYAALSNGGLKMSETE